MFLSGFADEAAAGIDGQIEAIKALGWSHIELRSIDGVNITDISNDQFAEVVDKLSKAGIQANAFGSTICNWSKSILDSIDRDLEEVNRAIPRMKMLGTKHVRIMSYAVLPNRSPEDQMVEERISRLSLIVDRFASAGLAALHENCANYGGMGCFFTNELLANVPGLKLIFDTANPATSLDRSKPEPCPVQSSWDFYKHVKSSIQHVHIKDGRFISEDPTSIFEKAEYVWPGEGNGDVERIITDLINNNYQGGLSIEPHMSIVFHEEGLDAPNSARFDNFVQYGRKLEAMIKRIRSGS